MSTKNQFINTRTPKNESPIRHPKSVSLAVSNAASGMNAACAFSFGATVVEDPAALESLLTLAAYPFPPSAWATLTTGGVARRGDGTRFSTRLAWQAGADRKDTDGKNIFTTATGASFGLMEWSLAVNQAWNRHDDAERFGGNYAVKPHML
ncbi:hypothetical protein F5B18DRAFT_647330 [Nemania serpens]|nr:hypothetical protein F5B18DRAFT_647330 [Nemania serpens]